MPSPNGNLSVGPTVELLKPRANTPAAVNPNSSFGLAAFLRLLADLKVAAWVAEIRAHVRRPREGSSRRDLDTERHRAGSVLESCQWPRAPKSYCAQVHATRQPGPPAVRCSAVQQPRDFLRSAVRAFRNGLAIRQPPRGAGGATALLSGSTCALTCNRNSGDETSSLFCGVTADFGGEKNPGSATRSLAPCPSTARQATTGLTYNTG